VEPPRERVKLAPRASPDLFARWRRVAPGEGEVERLRRRVAVG